MLNQQSLRWFALHYVTQKVCPPSIPNRVRHPFVLLIAHFFCEMVSVVLPLRWAAPGRCASQQPLRSFRAFLRSHSKRSLFNAIAKSSPSRCRPNPALRDLPFQSYVEHLPDGEGDHSLSLIRFCTYPQWPSHSLPRQIRRLVDRLIKSYLNVAHEGEYFMAVGCRQPGS